MDIKKVVALDLPNVTKYHAAKGFNIDCPFCKRKNKLNINTEKNVWACPACGESGGFLVLHSKLNGHGIDKKWASQDLKKKYSENPNIESTDAFKKIQEFNTTVKQTNAYSLEMRSRIFESYLKHLPLSKEFETELASDKRGNLDRNFADTMLYRSLSNKTFNSKYGQVNAAEFALIDSIGMVAKKPEDTPRIYENMVKKSGTRVPGFTLDNGRIISQEIGNVDFLPVRSRHGEISFLQTKYPALSENASEEEKAKYKKYGRYTSYGQYGCSTSGLENIHYTKLMGYDSKTTPKEVWLTEGILKSDIASYLSNKPFIALVGITAFSQLPDELKYLKEHGTESIVVATDMDYTSNPNVAKAMQKICKLIQESKIQCKIATWNNEFKGIDDFLIAASKGTSNLQINVKNYEASK